MAAKKDRQALPDRITKAIRITRELDNEVKLEATRRSITSGSRVSESDIVEAALLDYLRKLKAKHKGGS